MMSELRESRNESKVRGGTRRARNPFTLYVTMRIVSIAMKLLACSRRWWLWSSLISTNHDGASSGMSTSQHVIHRPLDWWSSASLFCTTTLTRAGGECLRKWRRWNEEPLMSNATALCQRASTWTDCRGQYVNRSARLCRNSTKALLWPQGRWNDEWMRSSLHPKWKMHCRASISSLTNNNNRQQQRSPIHSLSTSPSLLLQSPHRSLIPTLIFGQLLNSLRIIRFVGFSGFLLLPIVIGFVGYGALEVRAGSRAMAQSLRVMQVVAICGSKAAILQGLDVHIASKKFFHSNNSSIRSSQLKDRAEPLSVVAAPATIASTLLVNASAANALTGEDVTGAFNKVSEIPWNFTNCAP